MTKLTKTQAQKLKVIKDRQILTRKMRKIDPFYIHPNDIPKTKTYQWFSFESSSTPFAENEIESAKENGWKEVPFGRLNFSRRFRAKGKIVVKNCILLENSKAHTVGEREKEIQIAKFMVGESPIIPGKIEIVSPGFIVSREYDSVPIDAPPIVVSISLKFRMNRTWQDAAAFLGLENEEYARRRLLMTNPILYHLEEDDAYEAVYLSVEKQE